MRTNMQQLSYRIRKAVGLTDRPYEVDGTIFFILDSADAELDLSVLRQVIVEVDQLFPWKDEHPFTGEKFKSIKYLSEGKSKVDKWAVPVKTCFFNIYPGFERLTKGQLHAYENYLAKIAEELFKRKLSHVASVWGSVSTRKTFGFPGFSN